MPNPSSLTYLNTAGCGLVSEDTQQAGLDLYQNFSTNSSAAAETWREKTSHHIRKTLANFIHAPESNIALIPNFSFGINGIVQSLQGNEKVMLYKRDYPSLIAPFLSNNFSIEWIDDEDGFILSLEKIENLLRNFHIDIVAISHVQWLTGFKIDLKKIQTVCKKYNATLIVDATQSLGAANINIQEQPVDALIASNYKWMNAGFGSGILYISDQFLKTYPPKLSGHNNVTYLNGSWIHAASIQGFEPGHLNMHGFSILEKAIEEKNKIGLENIEQHNKQLTQYVLDEIKNYPVQLMGESSTENRSSIIFLKDENGLSEWLKQHNIIVTPRNGDIRISFHYYNTKADADALLHCLSAWRK